MAYSAEQLHSFEPVGLTVEGDHRRDDHPDGERGDLEHREDQIERSPQQRP